MHLARTVRIVSGCKENIWEAFQELFGEDLKTRAGTVVRSSTHKHIKKHADPMEAVRENFEEVWDHWER